MNANAATLATLATLADTFPAGSAVVGVRAGRFVVLGHELVGGEAVVRLKTLSADGAMGRGTVCLPADCIRAA